MRHPRIVAAGAVLVLAAGGGAAAYVVTRPGGGVHHHRATVVATPRPPLLVSLPSAAPEPTGRGLAVGLGAALHARALGRSVAVAVLDPASGRPLYDVRANAFVPPASTAKLATAVAVLHLLGGTARLTTRVALRRPNTVVLVGGGDPTLRAAQMTALATQTARALTARHVGRVDVGYDTSLFSGPAVAPGWLPIYLREGDVAPVSALEFEEARVHGRPGAAPRVPDPAAAAAAQFAAALVRARVRIDDGPTPMNAPRAPTLAAVSSAPVSELVEQMLNVSDNDLAEALARAVALHSGLPGSFTGATAAVRRALDAVGIDSDGLRMSDASGLSIRDRAQPLVLARLAALVASTAHPELRPALTGLPVAGFSGTLAGRFRTKATRMAGGLVRAKTGTLAGVSTLAGLVVDADGRLLAFAVVADQAPYVATAEAALDRVAAALATCGCR